jgi:hypothetical protein
MALLDIGYSKLCSLVLTPAVRANKPQTNAVLLILYFFFGVETQYIAAAEEDAQAKAPG